MVLQICVYAAEDKAKPIAIIVPAEPALKRLAAENGIEGHGLGDLVHNTKLQLIVLKELQMVGRKAGLSGIEIVEGVVMDDEEWTPQSVSFSCLFQCSCCYGLFFLFSSNGDANPRTLTARDW